MTTEVENKQVVDEVIVDTPAGEIQPTPPQKTVADIEPKQDLTQKQEPELTKDEVQARIDKMYAKLEADKTAAIQRIVPQVKPKKDEFGDDDDDDIVQKKDVLTRDELQAELNARDMQKAFRAAEVQVFMNHPSMLNEDGSFNLEDRFMKEYQKIGREEPALLNMINGPAIAEAMVEKRLGLAYKKGRVDEATRNIDGSINSYTAGSTAAAPNRTAAVTGKLSDVEKKVAARQGLSEQEYLLYKSNSKVIQKDWSK